MSLVAYWKKRLFGKTSEPKGGKKKMTGHFFVVQRHDASHLHYDFRLAFGGALKSWAVPKGPPKTPSEKRLAVHVEDHPLEYGSFQGTIPKGQYGAGTVKIWDTGKYSVEGASSEAELEKIMLKKYKNGELTFNLHGKKLKGEYVLVEMKGGTAMNGWLMLKRHADNAGSIDAPSKGSSRMPKNVKPMLAKVSEKPFSNTDWIFEVKWDGYRAIAEITKGKVSLSSRTGQSFDEKFAPIVKSLEKIDHDAVLDGEMVVLDKNGKSDFQLLQDYVKTGKGELVYQVFDLLYLDGHDLRRESLLKRKELLEDLLPKSSHIRYSAHIEKDGEKFFKKAEAAGLEGIMAKRADSAYESGRRTGAWLKMKTVMRQEAVIAGYTEPRGSRKHIGALILGVYQDGELAYIGHTGGGSDAGTLEELEKKLSPLKTDHSPFKNPPKPNAPVHWVKPKLLAEVKFQEWTKDGIMRQPILLGLREDKSAKDVVKETESVELTHEDKILYPADGYTKGDVLEYYKAVMPVLLPHLKDRPMSLHRFPNGIGEEGFYQKDVNNAPDFIRTEAIKTHGDKHTVHYLICDSAEAMEYMVQLASIEMHPWNSRIDSAEKPDYLVMDLDPEEDTPFSATIKTAQAMKRVLDRLHIPGYCKTSGAKGLHIFIPLAAKYTYDEVRMFAELLANLVHTELPELTTVHRESGGKGKVHLDYPQNRKGATTVMAYSLRAKPGATVSTPLKWSEVKAGLDPKKFTIKTVPARIKKVGDLWKPMLGEGIDLKKVLKNLP
jgi:bifunctional non-homologous end joining protein LigD